MSFKKALQVIENNDIRSPGDFAEKMWPDSPCWTHHHKIGNYSSGAGAMMPKVGGALLGKLRQRGYIGHFYPVILTEQGRHFLVS